MTHLNAPSYSLLGKAACCLVLYMAYAAFFSLLLAPLVQRVCGSQGQFSVLIDWGPETWLFWKDSFILIHITVVCLLVGILCSVRVCKKQQCGGESCSATWRSESGTICTSLSMWTQRGSLSGSFCFLLQTTSDISWCTVFSCLLFLAFPLSSSLCCFLFHQVLTCIPQWVR